MRSTLHSTRLLNDTYLHACEKKRTYVCIRQYQALRRTDDGRQLRQRSHSGRETSREWRTGMEYVEGRGMGLSWCGGRG